MKVLMTKDNFASERYDLQITDEALAFSGIDSSFVLPYSDVRNFSVTSDRRMKSYFSALCCGRIYEGQILKPSKIETFMTAMKEKMNGVMEIDVRRN